MAQESKFFPLVLIFLFSASIVALGVHELHESSLGLRADKSSKRDSSSNMVQELHGRSSPARASFSSGASGRKGSSDGEKLDRQDRMELRKLLDQVSK